MTKDQDGLRLRTVIILWSLGAVACLFLFNALIAALQAVIITFKEGIHSEEITTPLEALMYRLIRILFFDVKLILSTVLPWGILCYFAKSINATWKNMIISITTIYFVVVVTFYYTSTTKLGKAIISDGGAMIYLGLLVPRLIFNKLKPGKII
jgi:hypothetical protein